MAATVGVEERVAGIPTLCRRSRLGVSPGGVLLRRTPPCRPMCDLAAYGTTASHLRTSDASAIYRKGDHMCRMPGVLFLVFLTSGSAAFSLVTPCAALEIGRSIATGPAENGIVRRKEWIKRSLDRFFKGGTDGREPGNRSIGR